MVSFTLKRENKPDVDIYVPYDPLENLHASEMELSNCPSLEIDQEGNMMIAFGESSKQPRRKDNNYDQLIKGWKDEFGDYTPKTLKVKSHSISTFGEDQTNVSFCFEIRGKQNGRKLAELVFLDCKDVFVEMYFPQKGDCEILMSKMADGRIYVGFDGLGVEFICASVLEYRCYCNRTKE